jgi:CheY-like chemotaxis protein
MEALEYLRSKKDKKDLHPNLIFLDINMPGMNGWEFLSEYNKLDEKLKCQAVVVMLTTSENPDDKTKAKAMNVASDFKTKPLTQEMLKEIVGKYFRV